MMKLKNYIVKNTLKNIIVLGILFSFFYQLSFIDFKNIGYGFSRIGNLFSRMYPFDYTILPNIFLELFDTLVIALISTFLGLITTLIALPFLNNILFNIKIIPLIFSSLFSILRTIPSLIIAAILVSLFSVGNFSGFLTLYIISVLMSAKILKEYTEEIEKKYIDTYISAGFSKLKIYKVAILENMKSKVYSVFFLVLESNIRGASVLGLVGAGGIGQLLWKELNHLRYDRVSIIIIILILTILLTDLFSMLFRKIEFNKNISRKQYFYKKKINNIIFLSLLFLSVYYSFVYLNISGDRFISGFKNLKNMYRGILSPDISYSYKVIMAIYDSLIIAFISTLTAAITSVFLSLLASSNIVGNKLSLFSKLFINIIRTFPPIIIAIIFFRGFGPGYISSFFALYIYTLGVISKMYSDVIETIDSNIVMSIDSMGISRLIGYFKVIFRGYFPEFLSIVLLRFEMNIKNSTILGMVGIGGIGQLLINNIEFRNWERISLILIYLCILIIIIENISYFIRYYLKK
ncbi:PhnE/PtxC family ABC transporter permease [Gemelliphila palaticanis]|nr:ABC transporter permease subunit [Gemella palaticanis]